MIKNCNVYGNSNVLLVNDRYDVCSDLKDIAEAFGFSIKQIQCSLKGKNYIISDDLLNALKQFEKEWFFGKNVINQDSNELVKAILKENDIVRNTSEEILEMVRNIKKNGQYVTSKTRIIMGTERDGMVIEEHASEWALENPMIKEQLFDLSKNSQAQVNKTNTQLRDGTAKLLYSRARQMGYSVQEIKKGTQVQLVLVRRD